MAKAQFDREEVINKTIKLFWQHGYSATSMQQIVKATGLKPGSIYLAFGSKEGLFKEALETYVKINMNITRDLLDSSPKVEEGIIKILEKFIDDSIKAEYCSCFLIKTQLELGTEEGELKYFAAEQLYAKELLIKEYLLRVYNEEIATARATNIILHMFGLRVYGYQKEAQNRMKNALIEGLPWLPWSKK